MSAHSAPGAAPRQGRTPPDDDGDEPSLADLLRNEANIASALRQRARDGLGESFLPADPVLLNLASIAVDALARERDALRAERDAILRWSIRHAGWIGTTTAHGDDRWWARGDDGTVYAPTAEAAIRKAAGLEVAP